MKLATYVVAAIPLAMLVSPVHAGPIQFLVLPNAQATTLGNDSSGSLAGSIPSLEVEDIWNKSQFASVPGDLWITSFAFRLKPNTGPISATVTSAELYLSTTSFNSTTMSSTFAANRGADYTLVDAIGPGTLWSSTGCTASVTCPFDIVFTLTTPFLYDPSKGNLLVDVQFAGYSGVGTGEFDVENYLGPGGPVSELISEPAGPATGTLLYSDSITRLGYTVVTPEPASWTLMLFGLGAPAVMRWRRKSRSFDRLR